MGNNKVPVSLYPCQNLLFSVHLILDMLMGMKQYTTMVLISISLRNSVIEHPFIRRRPSIHLPRETAYSTPLFIFLRLNGLLERQSYKEKKKETERDYPPS